ncbi:MAG TPA: SprB repeat-containing protein [Cyclobacteriaceae bacterium]|nr:SprB repeat-containing protein [Cyclobacteriaceae bacterium]
MSKMLKCGVIYPAVILMLPWLFSSCLNEKGPEPADCESNPVEILSVNITKANCGTEDGSIRITASGGNGSYSYSIDGANFQTDSLFNGLAAGNYNILVSDEMMCTVADTVAVETVTGMTMNTSTTQTGCGTSSGSVTITVSGAKGAVQYKLGNGTFQDGNTFSNLEQGTYDVFAKDSSGCQVTEKVNINTDVSLENDIMPLLAANCALSGCHDGKSGLPNWTVKSTVISRASLIKQKTASGEMPPGELSITDEEIELIGCWVDDGAKNN